MGLSNCSEHGRVCATEKPDGKVRWSKDVRAVCAHDSRTPATAGSWRGVGPLATEKSNTGCYTDRASARASLAKLVIKKWTCRFSQETITEQTTMVEWPGPFPLSMCCSEPTQCPNYDLAKTHNRIKLNSTICRKF